MGTLTRLADILPLLCTFLRVFLPPNMLTTIRYLSPSLVALSQVMGAKLAFPFSSYVPIRNMGCTHME